MRELTVGHIVVTSRHHEMYIHVGENCTRYGSRPKYPVVVASERRQAISGVLPDMPTTKRTWVNIHQAGSRTMVSSVVEVKVPFGPLWQGEMCVRG
jgi:hypothetical protein